MDKDLYQIMQKLLETAKDPQADVKYLGVISIEEQTENGPVVIDKDIFAVSDIASDGSTITKYYDENMVCIAGRTKDGLFQSKSFLDDNSLDFLKQMEALDEKQGISLKEVDETLERVSKTLGISKSDVLSMSKIELDEVVKNKEVLDLSEEEQTLGITRHKEEQNQDVLANLQSKQEVSLNQKVDNRYTLAEIMGLPSGSKLIVVNSDCIKENENSTSFSCLIESPSGGLEKADQLIQVGGKDSDKNVFESNRDGSKIEQKQVKSSFAIQSSIVDNAIITIRQGEAGRIEVGYGQTDPTSHRDAFTERLETKEMWPITREVREEFSKEKGQYHITEKMDEIEEHEKHDCENLTLEEADGDLRTGHSHSEEAAELILTDEQVGEEINEVFTKHEVEERFESMREKNPEKDFDKLVEITKEELAIDAENMRGGERHH